MELIYSMGGKMGEAVREGQTDRVARKLRPSE